MIELIAGLAGTVVVFIFALFFSVKKIAKVTAKKEQAEAAIEVIIKANKAVKKVADAQEVDYESLKKDMVQRNYFS